MWILSIIILVAASLGALAAPVEATDLYTGPLDGGGFYCSATNKSSANLTVTLSILTFVSGVITPLETCGPFTVAGKKAAVCTHTNPESRIAYCKITTSSSTNTRGNLMVLDIGNNASALSEAK